MAVAINIFGPLEVRVDAKPVVLKMQQQRVLALLAAAAGEWRSADSLVDQVWDTSLPANPKATVIAAVNVVFP